MSKKDAPRPGGEIIVYQAADGGSRIRVLLEGETVWLPQAMIADLFQTSVPNVNIHLKNIYVEGELDEAATIKEYLIVRREAGKVLVRSPARCFTITSMPFWPWATGCKARVAPSSASGPPLA